MSSNANDIVPHLDHEMHALIAYVTGPQAATQTVSTVELALFRRLLALGAALLRLFFLSRAAARPPAPVLADGTVLAAHGLRPTSYFSVFGKLSFVRHYFVTAGHTGVCPLDAALSLPDRCSSDLLSEWATFGTTDAAYRETQTLIARMLDLPLSIQMLERETATAAADVTAFYQQPLERTPPPAGILVVQADGKGIPMVPVEATDAPLRLGKGQKRTKKKEAIVSCLYTVAPYVRTPQDVRAALLHEGQHAELPTRPAPVQKELRATLDGKACAISMLSQRARMRDGGQITARVALTDGAPSLQQQLSAAFPAHTLVLDIIHASEYLWERANTLLGESSPARLAWVRAKLEQVLNGQTGSVIAAREAEMDNPQLNSTQRQVVARTLGYYQRNQQYMHYDAYLAQGWPIGTGVVEGACGHLVKDRMEQAGMRWTQAGAQAVRDLRAVRLNEDWDDYWVFHRCQQHTRRYGTPSGIATPEAQVLQMAA